MVAIPEDVQKMIRDQQIIVVGTSDETGLVNISPRTSFHLSEDHIYWLELFKHKTFHNLQKNNWVSIAVFDKAKLSGFQLKGKVRLVTDKEKFFHVQLRIVDHLTRLNKERILRQIGKESANIIEFTPKIVYQLNPNEVADIPIVLDADVEVAHLAGGVDMKTSFGMEPESLSGVF